MRTDWPLPLTVAAPPHSSHLTALDLTARCLCHSLHSLFPLKTGLEISVSISSRGLNRIVSKLLSQYYSSVLCSFFLNFYFCTPFLNLPVAPKMSGEALVLSNIHRWWSAHRGQVGEMLFSVTLQEPRAMRRREASPAGLAFAGPHALWLHGPRCLPGPSTLQGTSLSLSTVRLCRQANKPSSSGCTGAYLPKVMSQNDVHNVGGQA